MIRKKLAKSPKTIYYVISFYEMSTVDKSIETKWLPRAWADWEERGE